jgi:hypothetical protein
MTRQPTYREVLLFNRIIKEEDYSAIEELWPLLFAGTGRRFNPDRPLPAIMDDLTARMQEVYPQEKAEEPTPPPPPKAPINICQFLEEVGGGFLEGVKEAIEEDRVRRAKDADTPK